MSPKTNQLDDPRNSSLETPFVLPKTWHNEASNDGASTSGMLLSMLIMVTRNRYLAWPAMLFGIATLINEHPVRSDKSLRGWSNLALCFSALIASYIPVFVISNK